MQFPDWPAKAPFVHVVLFRLPAGAPSTKADEIIHDIDTLLKDLETVEAIWFGSPADTAAPERPMVKNDYDVGLLVLFKDKPALDAYLKNPDHMHFAKKWDGYCELRVFDFVQP